MTSEDVYWLMPLVSLQVGIQPQVTRSCVASGVSGRSLVLAEMAVGILLAAFLLPRGSFALWYPWESLSLVGPPAMVYALRSLLKQAAYQRCDGVTFNVMNQTKVVFCAAAAWLLLGEAQTLQQCFALLCAVAASAILATPTASAKAGAGGGCSGGGESDGGGPQKLGGASCRGGTAAAAAADDDGLNATMGAKGAATRFSRGASTAAHATKAKGTLLFRGGAPESAGLVLRPTFSGALQVPPPSPKGAPATTESSGMSMKTSGALLALATAACSGTAAALSQAAMRHHARPSTLFNLELGLWGLPFVMLTGGSAGGAAAGFGGWSRWTLAPVVLQAFGGLLVSALVKSQGGVAMGLCTVVGIAISAAVDAVALRRPPSLRQVVAAGLCTASVFMHQWGSFAAGVPSVPALQAPPLAPPPLLDLGVTAAAALSATDTIGGLAAAMGSNLGL